MTWHCKFSRATHMKYNRGPTHQDLGDVNPALELASHGNIQLVRLDTSHYHAHNGPRGQLGSRLVTVLRSVSSCSLALHTSGGGSGSSALCLAGGERCCGGRGVPGGAEQGDVCEKAATGGGAGEDLWGEWLGLLE